MNDKKETMDDLRELNKREAEEKAGNIYESIKNEPFPDKYLKLKEMYQIKQEGHDFSFVTNHSEEIDNLDEEFKKTIINKEEERKKDNKETNRKPYKPENWIAKFIVKECKNNEQKFDASSIGVFFDFEIPTGQKGKNIDLLSFNEEDNIVRIIELKKNDDEYFKAIIELLDYYIRSKGYDLENCELKKHPYLKNKKINVIKMAILAHSESLIVREFKENKYPNIKQLLALFDIEFYSYKTKKHNTVNEEIIVESIDKLN